MRSTAQPMQLTTWVDEEVRRRYEKSGAWTGDTWRDRLLAATEAEPERLAVADEQGSLTRAEVLASARRVAAYLWQRGVRPGDVVSLAVPNWREFVVIHAAVGLLGGVVNPMLPKVGAAEMRHAFATAGTRYAFAAAEHRRVRPMEVVREAARGLDHVLGAVAVRDGGAHRESLEAILAEPWEERVTLGETAVDARGPDTVVFTSGTEALPKGVVHSHQTGLFDLRAYITDLLGLDERDRVFMPSPVCHASGLQWGLRTAIVTGAPLILQDRWDPATALAMIDEHRCTYTLAATPFLVDLVAAKRAGHGDGGTLRYVASGGAAIPRPLVGEIAAAFGAELMAVFGSSETYVATATRPGDGDELLATDGAPLPGTEVVIADEHGRPLPPGQEGEILTRGPHVFLGYLGDPDLTRRSFHGEWYRFGDLGRFDEHGRLHVTGRIKDIVIRGGENISVREVEEALAEHPAVAAVAIVGYPDERLGERCCAVVVAAGDAEPELEELVAFLVERGIARFKLPERLELLAEMPMTASGKIRKAELRERLAEGRL